MTQLNQIWKCNICGNIVTILHSGADSLVCCGEPMNLIEAKTQDEGNAHRSVYNPKGRENLQAGPKTLNEGAKHIPIIKRTEDEMTFVKIGEIEHPMDESHYIEWIELENKDKGKVCRKNINPGEKPESKFCAKTDNTQARCYCNVHGLWKNK